MEYIHRDLKLCFALQWDPCLSQLLGNNYAYRDAHKDLQQIYLSRGEVKEYALYQGDSSFVQLTITGWKTAIHIGLAAKLY